MISVGEPDRFEALFDPKGILVAGVSSHPGKFGFVAAHNILRFDYRGDVWLLNRDGGEILGRECVSDVAQIPDGAVDLVFVCTPAAANPDLLRACAAKGVRAAFVASAGYVEAGEEGAAAQDELVALCDDLGILLAGPNGQGVVSTPSSLCAQIVAPYPPRGGIGVVSQSGNFVSSWLNYATHFGVGVSRAVSAGNSASLSVPDYLQYFAHDPETTVGLAYVESIPDGRSFAESVRSVTSHQPVVVVKGGTTGGGAKAAASHTGAMATDDTVFDGIARQIGLSRAQTIEEAYEAAAAFATLPLPTGPRVFVLSTAGGWGVITADAITSAPELELMPLPDDLRVELDARLPPRWSRNNPADLAGGETRDTVPELIDIVAGHPDVDAVLFVGLGIQANQASVERSGAFYPEHGLERIVEYHDRQDRRYADAAVTACEKHGKPVLVSTELAVTQPGNAGVARVRELGHMCFPSTISAVRALRHMVRYAKWSARREP
ncbi:MAG: CoA-binding protein [Acidimicrobiia bacterium]|nr:CoA-binding protein [Acidimicrobiia bacterium]